MSFKQLHACFRRFGRVRMIKTNFDPELEQVIAVVTYYEKSSVINANEVLSRALAGPPPQPFARHMPSALSSKRRAEDQVWCNGAETAAQRPPKRHVPNSPTLQQQHVTSGLYVDPLRPHPPTQMQTHQYQHQQLKQLPPSNIVCEQ